MSDSPATAKSLAGKVALITGAGKRIGRALALHLAGQGADIAVHYNRSREEAEDAVSQIVKLGSKGVALQADLTSVPEIQRLFRQAEENFGRLDVLINSAANFLHAGVAETTEKLWDAALDTNVKAPFFCAQAAAPLLKQSRGVIINFADVGGILAWPGYIAHGAAKAGVIMLTKSLAKALAPEVRVNAIAPGTITMEGDPSDWETHFIQRAPLRRSGRTADVADAVSFLIHSNFITGHTLVLDGGRSL